MVSLRPGGRGGVPVRLGFAAAGFKAVGLVPPLLAFGPCRGWPGLNGGLPRLGHFARVPGVVSLGSGGRGGVLAWLRFALAKHRSLAQARLLGQRVHGQRVQALLGEHLAGGGEQVPPVARGVGALGARRSPGHGLVHGSYPMAGIEPG